MSFASTLAFNQVTRQESVVTPLWRQAAGEYPDPNFPFLSYVYTRDTDCYTAVNFVKNRALSRGWHIECAADSPNYMRGEAERFLEDWLKYVRWGDDRNERGFKALAGVIMQEMAYAGTSMLEQLDSPQAINALAAVQVSSIQRFQRDYTGQLRYIWQQPAINPTPLTPSRYIIFKWNTVDRNPWGYGLLHSLCYPRQGPRGEVIPPLILSWWQMQDDARRRLHRYASPRSIFQVKGLDEAQTKPMAEAMKDPEADASFVTNGEVGIAMDAPTSRGNFQSEFDLLRNRMDIGLSAMLSALISSDKGFSYASSQTGESMSDIIVWDLQQNFKGTVDNELLGPVAEQNGFDANLLHPELVYNIPDEPEEYDVKDMLTAFQLGAISLPDLQKNLKDFASWDITETPQAPVPMPGNLPMGTQSTDPRMAMSPMVQRDGSGMMQSLGVGSPGVATGADAPVTRRDLEKMLDSANLQAMQRTLIEKVLERMDRRAGR